MAWTLLFYVDMAKDHRERRTPPFRSLINKVLDFILNIMMRFRVLKLTMAWKLKQC